MFPTLTKVKYLIVGDMFTFSFLDWHKDVILLVLARASNPEILWVFNDQFGIYKIHPCVNDDVYVLR